MMTGQVVAQGRWSVRLLLAAGVVVAVAALPQVASAEVISGECTGSARFVDGTADGGSFTVDITQPLDEVVVVPRSDTVEWTGSTAATGGDHSGAVSVDLPFPLGAVEIADWSGTLSAGSGSGVDTYDLPAAVPGGVEFTARVVHIDSAGTCEVALAVAVEGGPLDGPVAPIALAATAVFAVGALGVGGAFGARGVKRAAAHSTSVLQSLADTGKRPVAPGSVMDALSSTGTAETSLEANVRGLADGGVDGAERQQMLATERLDGSGAASIEDIEANVRGLADGGVEGADRQQMLASERLDGPGAPSVEDIEANLRGLADGGGGVDGVERQKLLASDRIDRPTSSPSTGSGGGGGSVLRSLAGALVGLPLGTLIGVDLVLFGVVPLGSVVVAVVAIGGLVLGALSGGRAARRRRRA